EPPEAGPVRTAQGRVGSASSGVGQTEQPTGGGDPGTPEDPFSSAGPPDGAQQCRDRPLLSGARPGDSEDRSSHGGEAIALRPACSLHHLPGPVGEDGLGGGGCRRSSVTPDVPADRPRRGSAP